MQMIMKTDAFNVGVLEASKKSKKNGTKSTLNIAWIAKIVHWSSSSRREDRLGGGE